MYQGRVMCPLCVWKEDHLDHSRSLKVKYKMAADSRNIDVT